MGQLRLPRILAQFAPPPRRQAPPPSRARRPPAPPALALRHADPALHFPAFGPADVRQRKPQHVLRVRIPRHFPLATVESNRRAGRRLGKKPNVNLLARSGLDLARQAEGVFESADGLADAI